MGYELGTQFTRHHEVVDYYEYLAESAPDRVQLTVYGKTNERRPLILAYVSSAENLANLETIRQELDDVRGVLLEAGVDPDQHRGYRVGAGLFGLPPQLDPTQPHRGMEEKGYRDQAVYQ